MVMGIANDAAFEQIAGMLFPNDPADDTIGE